LTPQRVAIRDKWESGFAFWLLEEWLLRTNVNRVDHFDSSIF
jgi:hypothetical protein